MTQQTKNPEEAGIRQDEQQTAQSQPPLTVMAIQDLLGLFSPKEDTGEKDRHDYLKKKPLGLI